MADCEWIIVCDYAFPAMQSKLCMIGIFDIMFAPAVPFNHEKIFIGFNLVGEPGEKGETKLEIIAPTGTVISSAKGVFTLPDTGSAFGAMQVVNLELPEFGRYAIQIDLGESVPKQAWFTLLERNLPGA